MLQQFRAQAFQGGCTSSCKISFCEKDDTLKEAIRRLATLREKALSVGEAEWK